MKGYNNRLVPLETLYAKRKPPVQERSVQKKKTPFYKPGITAAIPSKAEDIDSVRYLRASTLRHDLQTLEKPIKDIENDISFIAESMNSALQVPRSLELTFNRIHGRIYDIQREIEYSSNETDVQAMIIQNNYRMISRKNHLKIITNAINHTIQRDCSSIHQSLLGFLLSYSKADDQFKMSLNRRFLVRNRNALKFWSEWTLKSKENTKRLKNEIIILQNNWLKRTVLNFIRKWKLLSFSKHSRKSLIDLQARITNEAQRRLADRTATLDESQSRFTILELLALEREGVIIDIGKENYKNHMENIVFRYWKLYVEQCKKESRSGNAIARQFYISRIKRSFFNAWFSLSVGRVVVFGGYYRWHKPENRRLVNFQNTLKLMRTVLREWKLIITRKEKLIIFSKKREKEFVRSVFLAFHNTANKRHETLSKMMESYLNCLHRRMHRVFGAWRLHVTKERERKLPMKFILERSLLFRKYRNIKGYFRKWQVRYHQKSGNRFLRETQNVCSYIDHWNSAGEEMYESMNLISKLNEKLTKELNKIKVDLSKSRDTINFMLNEQRSLAFAMKNAQFELEMQQLTISKSSMRYFVEVKPIHNQAIDDIPGALNQYIEQKEQEKARLIAQKQSQNFNTTPNNQKQRQSSNVMSNKKRKPMFPQSHSRVRMSTNSRSSIRSKKSTTQSNGSFDVSEEEEEE